MRFLTKNSAVIFGAVISSITLFSANSANEEYRERESESEKEILREEHIVHISVQGANQTFWIPDVHARTLDGAERQLKERGFVAHDAEGKAGTYKGGTRALGGRKGVMRRGWTYSLLIKEDRHKELATLYIENRITTLKYNVGEHSSAYEPEALKAFDEELRSLEDDREHQLEKIMGMMKDGTIHILIQSDLGSFRK